VHHWQKQSILSNIKDNSSSFLYYSFSIISLDASSLTIPQLVASSTLGRWFEITVGWVSLYSTMSQDAYVTMLFSDGYLQGKNSFPSDSINGANGYFEEPKSLRHRYEMVGRPRSWRSLFPPMKLIDFFHKQSPSSRYKYGVSNHLNNLGIIWLRLINANICFFKYVKSAAFRSTRSCFDIDEN